MRCGALGERHMVEGEAAELRHRLHQVTGPRAGCWCVRVRGRNDHRPRRLTGCGGRCGTALDKTKEVALGHSPGDAAAAELRDLDAMLGGDPSNERRTLGAEALVERQSVPTILVTEHRRRTRHGWPRRNLRYRCRGDRRNVRRCGCSNRRWRRSDRRTLLRLDPRHQCLDRHGFAFADDDLGEHASRRRRNLGVHLVR